MVRMDSVAGFAGAVHLADIEGSLAAPDFRGQRTSPEHVTVAGEWAFDHAAVSGDFADFATLRLGAFGGLAHQVKLSNPRCLGPVPAAGAAEKASVVAAWAAEVDHTAEFRMKAQGVAALVEARVARIWRGQRAQQPCGRRVRCTLMHPMSEI